LTEDQSQKPRIEKLDAKHKLTEFDCGTAALNRFLRQHALNSQRSDSAQTYVALIDETVAGYHSLAAGNVLFDDAPERLAKGLPRHPVPVIVLARLAVDRRFRRRSLGSGLLRDALRRTGIVSEIAGVRGLVVHAKDDDAKVFYQHFGFVSFVDKPLTLFRLLKDIRSEFR
jgi:GNAT superfamily N-acetyltransferase